MADGNTTEPRDTPYAHTSTLPADVAELLEKGGDVVLGGPVENADGSTTYFVGEKIRAINVPALNPVLPGFVSQAETFVLPVSFIDYLVKFQSSNAIVRAHPAASPTPKFVAVLDYHGAARMDQRDAALPGRASHIVTLNCPWDPDYAKWRAIFDKPISQTSIMEFFEDLIHTVADPLAGDLLDAVGNVELDRETKFKSVRNLRNGTVQFVYAEEERGGSTVLPMPEVIKVVTPIFQGGGSMQLDVKLRYATEKGELFFKLVLPGREKLERDGFRTIGDDIQQRTGTQVFYAA